MSTHDESSTPGHARTELNRQLATLLGWTRIEQAGQSLVGTPPWWAGNSRGQAAVPDWEQDWVACGALMATYHCYPYAVQLPGRLLLNANGPGRLYSPPEDAARYRSPEHAARAAVIKAVIRHLSTARG